MERHGRTLAYRLNALRSRNEESQFRLGDKCFSKSPPTLFFLSSLWGLKQHGIPTLRGVVSFRGLSFYRSTRRYSVPFSLNEPNTPAKAVVFEIKFDWHIRFFAHTYKPPMASNNSPFHKMCEKCAHVFRVLHIIIFIHFFLFVVVQ